MGSLRHLSIPTVRTAGSNAIVAESWRLFGLLVFAGLFLLLGYRPRLYPGVWELVIFHKAATAAYLFVFASGGADTTATVTSDGVLTIALVTAYLLVWADRNWHRFRTPSPVIADRSAGRDERES